jgi:hypothetical protein
MNMTIYEYKSRCEWLAKFYAEAAETGRAMQVFGCCGWVDYDESPSIQSIPDNWRIKPEPQKAWVVWGPGGPSTILGESYAKQYARECGGTIQEITRPEPQ